MKIRYLLKKKGKGEHSHLVYVALYHNEVTEIISTGQRCQPSKDWNDKKGEPRYPTSDLYKAVAKVRAGIDKAIKELDFEEKPITPFTVKSKHNENLKKKEDEQYAHDKKDKGNLLSLHSLVADYLKLGLDNLKEGTQNSVKDSLKVFTDYLESAGLKSADRRQLDERFTTAYARHLSTTMKYADSTHGRCIKHFRWYLKYIGYPKAAIEEIKIRRPKKSQRNIISLTEEELIKVENVDVAHDPLLQKAKDMFLLGCYTGLRISDLKRISKECIVNNSIDMTLRKNETQVFIPIISKCNKILARYDYRAPKMCESEVNIHIKTVCDKADLTTEIRYKYVKDGKVSETIHYKHAKISTHCAGKTFISLAGEKWNLSVSDIAAIVGKDVRTIMDYYMNANVKAAREKMIEADNRQQMQVAV